MLALRDGLTISIFIDLDRTARDDSPHRGFGSDSRRVDTRGDRSGAQFADKPMVGGDKRNRPSVGPVAAVGCVQRCDSSGVRNFFSLHYRGGIQMVREPARRHRDQGGSARRAGVVSSARDRRRDHSDAGVVCRSADAKNAALAGFR